MEIEHTVTAVTAREALQALASEGRFALTDGWGDYTPEQLLSGWLDPILLDLPARLERAGDGDGLGDGPGDDPGVEYGALRLGGYPLLAGSPSAPRRVVASEIACEFRLVPRALAITPAFTPSIALRWRYDPVAGGVE